MASVSGSYQSLLQGISQQPEDVRLDGQSNSQINFLSDPVRGLVRRAGSENLFRLDESFSKDTKFYEYSRGDGERYLVTITKGFISVYGVDGQKYNVVGNPISYISTENSRDDISLTTIGDLTVITNKRVKARMKPELSVGTKHSSLVITGSAWATTFTIKIKLLSNGAEHTVQYRTASGIGRLVDRNGDLITPPEPEVDPERITPLYVAQRLYELINAVSPNAILSIEGETIYFNIGVVSILSVNDGNAGKFIKYVEDVVRSVSELPQSTVDGRIVKVSKNATNGAGDYYLKYKDNVLLNGKGRWEETIKDGLQYAVDASSMPHALVRLVENDVVYFVVSQLDGSKYPHLDGEYEFPRWKDRLVGDDESNPVSSVFGKEINDVGVFQERLFFLMESEVVFSSANDYWDLFVETAVTVSQADPISIEVSTGKIHNLVSYTVQDGDLIVFSDIAQHRVSGVEPITPMNASISPVSFFESKIGSGVLPYGRYSYFPYSSGQYSGIRELTTGDFNNTKDAPSVTEHVSRYIRGDVDVISSSEEEGIIFVSSRVDGEPTNRLYTYKLAFDGVEKIQASWSHWEYGDNFVVEFHWCIYSKLYVVLSNTESKSRNLVVHDLTDRVVESFGFNVYLDFMTKAQVVNGHVEVEQAYNGMVIVQGSGCPNEGMIAGKVLDDPKGQSRVVAVDSDIISGEVIVGMPYLSAYSPTRPFVKDNKGVPITTGYLMVSRYIVSFIDSGFLTANVGEEAVFDGGDVFSGRVVGSDDNVVGRTSISSGSITVPVLRASGDFDFNIFTKDFRPVVIRGIEWEGQYNSNKRRL